jgi:C2 domain
LEGAERILHLASPKYGEKGQIQIRLLFEPEIIAKTRKHTSTFTATMTTIGGMPMGAGKGVIQGVSGVLHLPGKNKEGDIVSQDFAGHVDQAVQPTLPSAVLPPIPTATPDVQADHNSGNGTNEPGTLRVTILDAKALASSDAKPYVVVRVGSLEHKTKHAAKSTSTPEWYAIQDYRRH